MCCKQSVAVGSTTNNLDIIQRAGLGIVFNAGSEVQAGAPCRLSSITLHSGTFYVS